MIRALFLVGMLCLQAFASGSKSTDYWKHLDELLTRNGATVYLREKVKGQQAVVREAEVQFRMHTRLLESDASTQEDWEGAQWHLAVQRVQLEKLKNNVLIASSYGDISLLEIAEGAGETVDVKKLEKLYEQLGRARCRDTNLEEKMARLTVEHQRRVLYRRQRLYQKKALSYSELLEAQTKAGEAEAELAGRLATQKICRDFLNQKPVAPR